MYSMYVGEGEELLRNTFRQARLAAPSILFLDEVDAMAGGEGVCAGRDEEGKVCMAGGPKAHGVLG